MIYAIKNAQMTKGQIQANKRKGAAYPSKQWATVRTHFLAMRTQPQMCPLGSVCREHCQGHLPGRLVRPPRILLFIRAAGRRPQSTKEQERTDRCDSTPNPTGCLHLCGHAQEIISPPAWIQLGSYTTVTPRILSPCLVHRREILLLL